MSGRRNLFGWIFDHLITLGGDRTAVSEGYTEVEWGAASPDRIRIVPDDYHVPYAGTAADGRRFFVSEETFDGESQRQFVSVFLWTSTGEFDELRVSEASRPSGLPPQQARPSADGGAEARLAELAPYVLEPIEVAPFEQEWEGIRFGFIEREIDGSPSVYISPGDFIAYYEPWDGEEYDT